MDSTQQAIEELRRAIKDKGPVPAYHDDILRRHRREWPTLWEAIDKLLSIDER